MDDLIRRADMEQTVDDNILCYTHSDRAIDRDPDTECHKAIRTALRMLRKDLRKLPPAQSNAIPLEWIAKHLEWLDNCDNEFVQLAKVSIRAMVELWKNDQIL